MADHQGQEEPVIDQSAPKPQAEPITREQAEASQILSGILGIKFPAPIDQFGCMTDMLAHLLVRNSTDLDGMRRNLAELHHSVSECCEANWKHEEKRRAARDLHDKAVADMAGRINS